MSERTREKPAAAPPRLEGREAAIAALEGLHWLLERVSIYPPGHPVVQGARDRTWEALAAHLETAGTLRAEAGRDLLRVGSRRVDSLRGRALGSTLAELDIVALELHRGLEADEVLQLVRRVARLKASGGVAAARDEIAALDGGKASPHVVLGLLDYDAIPIDEGAQAEPEADDEPERIWSALSQSILGPTDSPRTLAPEHLAGLLGDEIVQEGAGPEVLSGQLQRLLEDIEDLDPDARREAQARIGRFVSALPPALREELLRIDPTLSRAQPLRPDSIVTALLLGAVQGGDRPPEDAVALLNQLLRSTTGDDPGLRDLLERVAAGEAPPEELDRLGAAVSEIFRKREDIQANPQDYQKLIDSLARAGVKAAANADRWKDQFDDPRDAAGNRAHAVEIAAEQFRDRGAAEHAETVLAYLRDSVDPLIDTGRLEALRTAVRAAGELAASEQIPDSFREAASAWARETIVPPRLARILSAAVPDEALIDPALDLARRAGDGAADAIFPVLASAPRTLVEGLLDILAGLPAERILAHARSCSAAGWSGLRPVFPVLRRLDAPAVQDFVVELLEHPEENVRSHALDALNDRSLESGHVSDLLFALLQDPSPRIVKEAVRKLGALEGDAAVELLGDFVRGRLIRSAGPPPLEQRLFATRVLTLRGAPGWRRLEGCLARLSWKLRGDDVEVAHAIASVLERRTSDAGAARAIRRWRWSPARRLGGLFRKGKGKVQW
jgi:hypothetical protein